MIGPQHRTAIRHETIISVAVNALIPTAIIWAAGVTPPAALGGADGLLQAMTKASGLATLAMTGLVTQLIRVRVRKRHDLALDRTALPPLVAALPSNPLIRAIILAIVAVVLLVPAGTVVARVLGILPLGVGGFVVFNLLFGALVGLTMTPVVVLRAMADRTGASPR